MPMFTLIGYWADTQQRFATHLNASGPAEAEEICLQRHRGVAICGVVRGRHICLDKAAHVGDGLGKEICMAKHDGRV